MKKACQNNDESILNLDYRLPDQDMIFNPN